MCLLVLVWHEASGIYRKGGKGRAEGREKQTSGGESKTNFTSGDNQTVVSPCL